MGQFGSERLRRFDCIGHTINLAARLHGVAESGQIVVSDTFAARIHDQFMMDDGRVTSLKGIGEITVHHVLGERTVR